MGFFKRGGGLGSNVLTIPTFMALFILAYFLGSLGMQSFNSSKEIETMTAKGMDACNDDLEELLAKTKVARQKGCDTIEDFIEDGNYGDVNSSVPNPWRQLKWGLPPARCRVNGHLIERLDPDYNYRRGVALRFTDDLDDKTHIEHWFLGTKVDLNNAKRRVFLDLGANYFTTSLLWFNTRYPCDFTEVHAFEVDSNLLHLPEGFDEESNWKTSDGPGWKKLQGRNGYFPQWMVDRIHTYNQFVGDHDNKEKNYVNITRFMKEELKLTEDDTVVVKMDIEGSEWPILERWVRDPEMPKIIDELWVEVHYYHPDNNWETVKKWSREKTTRMLAELRFRGFYVHYWD